MDDRTGFRVEELAARTGTPVRTIREYQTWQVLHPPTRMGRIGLYDESHVRRMETIARLQERGYSIAAIRDLLKAFDEGVGLGDVLGIGESIGAPVDEASMEVSPAQLEKLVPSITGSDQLRRRAVEVGLLVEDGDRLLTRSPSLVQLVADMIDGGLPPTAALDLVATVVSSASAVGEAIAGIVAAGAARHGSDSVGPLLRRGRLLLVRAVAAHTIDQVGRHLVEHAPTSPGLDELIAEVRIGHVEGPG